MELVVDSGQIAEKSLDTNGQVILDNTNLNIATSLNYHHLFPKAYLEPADPSTEPNLIANITLIDGYSNKHRITKKRPAATSASSRSLTRHLARHCALISSII